jgi:elongation factor G
VVGVEVALVHGEYDILCSTEEHLAQAGEIALTRALEEGGTELVEPVCTVDLEVPTQKTGDVLADVAAHRGRVQGLENDGCTTVLEVECPYRELRTLPLRLSALTGGRGRLTWKLSHYRRVDMADVATQREPCRPSR